MKIAFLPAVLGMGLFLVGVAPASAALVYDPFDYSPVGADLTGQTPDGGTTLWQSMGAAGSDPITIANGSLSVAGLASATGNSIIYGGLGFTNRIPLGQTFTSGTLYFSFAFTVTDLGTLSTTGGFMAGFNNATGNVTNQPTQIGTRVVTKANGAGFQVGLDKTSGMGANFQFDNTVFNLGDPVFVVGSYTFNSGSTTDDESRLWINPDPSTFGLEPAPATSLISFTGNDLGAPAPGLASFLFRQGNATAVPGAVIADELRVDTTWAGVTPVPEPSCLGLLAVAASCALLRRRRCARG